MDDDDVGKGLGGTELTSGVVGKHDRDTDTEDTLAEHDVADSSVNVVVNRVTRLDHVTITELHGLGTLASELSRDNDLKTLGSTLHDEADDSVAGTADGETSKELVLERLSLGDGAESTALDGRDEKLDGVGLQAEALLDDGGELADAKGSLSDDALGAVQSNITNKKTNNKTNKKRKRREGG